MHRAIEPSRYLIEIAVVFLLIGAAAAFIWGGIKAVSLVTLIITTAGKDPEIGITVIQLVDAFLIATAPLIVAASLHELFIGPLNLPESMVAHTFNELKAKLSNVIILVLGVTFLEHLVDWRDPLGTLYFGLSVAVVSAVLIAFSYFGLKSGSHD